MKKFFLIAICVLLAGASNAQTFFNGARTDYDNFYQTRVGVAIGAGLSGVQGVRNNFNSGAVAGFNAGFTLDYPINHNLIIRSELLYSQKGYSASTSAGNFTQRSQFVDIPLLARMPVGRIDLFAGPQFSYMISNSYNFGGSFNSNQDYYKYTGSRTFVAGVVGAGVNLTQKVDLYARYAIDIKGINTNGSTFLPSYRNQALQISLGFQIN